MTTLAQLRDEFRTRIDQFEARLDTLLTGIDAPVVERVDALIAGKITPAEAEDAFVHEILGLNDQPEVVVTDDRPNAAVAAAEWMRSKGVVPAGKALEAVRNGERNPRTLRRMNLDDGLMVREKGVPPEGVQQPTVKEPGTQADDKAARRDQLGADLREAGLTETEITATLARAGF